MDDCKEFIEHGCAEEKDEHDKGCADCPPFTLCANTPGFIIAIQYFHSVSLPKSVPIHFASYQIGHYRYTSQTFGNLPNAADIYFKQAFLPKRL